MKSRTWQSRDQWRTLAYREYRDSREWRHLLALNPSYDIRTRPAPGIKVIVAGELGTSEPVPSLSGRSGMLKAPGMTLEPITGSGSLFESTEPPYFPWSSEDAYMDRVGEYTGMSLMARDRTNGFGIDSRQALSDSQRG